eukprot:m.225765 g.225765  ORF g.225765 m.225765 type:complete len:1796 (+) comp40019_c0_seq3:374-5761(+)
MQAFGHECIDAFHKKMSGLTFRSCDSCDESWPTLEIRGLSGLCRQCWDDHKFDRVGLLTEANNMNPGPVPPALKNLTAVEEMLIAKIAPMMKVYRLPSGRQYGYSGHVLNLPQDVQSIVTKLPRTIGDIDLIVVRQEKPSGQILDFRVRRKKVLDALVYLKEHNKYYSNIEIDEVALKTLPDDAELNLKDLQVIKEKVPIADIAQDTSPVGANELDEDEDCADDTINFTHSVFPSKALGPTEAEKMRSMIDNLGKSSAVGGEMAQSPKMPHESDGQQSEECVLAWPTTGSTPINEFTREGYWTQAFPALFPTGAEDFRSPRLRSVTLGQYLKHLMRFQDRRFAQHPRFRYFALNTLMRWRALETARVFIKQNPDDIDLLTVADLKGMAESSSNLELAKKVIHFGKSLHGSKQYWSMQRRNLFAMQEKLGPPSCFFTLSAADLHWPELFDLAQHYRKGSNKDDNFFSDYKNRNKTLNENPFLADWFFTKRAFEFLHTFMVNVLGFRDHWAPIEYQHRGSAHMHGLGWIRDAPDFEGILKRISSYPQFQLRDEDEANREECDEILAVEGKEIVDFTDWLVTTVNPSLDSKGEGALPTVKMADNPCHVRWRDVSDHNNDYQKLLSTVQRHTRCKPSTCLKSIGAGMTVCRYGYPKSLQMATELSVFPFLKSPFPPAVETKRNDPRINIHNPLQLQGWRANVDLQVCVDAHAVSKYCVKYATKSEPQSQSLKEIFKTTTGELRAEDGARKVVSKLLMKCVVDRDYSAQETCHLIMGEKLVTSSREFVTLHLDRKEGRKDARDKEIVTATTAVEQYMRRPKFADSLCLMDFVSDYRIDIKGEIKRRSKSVVVRVVPRIVCNPKNAATYEQYCYYQLMKYKPFRQLGDLKTETCGQQATAAESYRDFLASVGSSLQSRIDLSEDIDRLLINGPDQQQRDCEAGKSAESGENPAKRSRYENVGEQEDWMQLLCPSGDVDTHDDLMDLGSTDRNHDWSSLVSQYPPLLEASAFVATCRNLAASEKPCCIQNDRPAVDPSLLQGDQKLAYDIVQSHNSFSQENSQCQPLRMIVCGSAGTGKSFLISCMSQLLGRQCMLAAPTGVAAFNIGGQTLHSLFRLPIQKGSFTDLSGPSLQELQEKFADSRYLIIDEMSMVSQRQLSLVHRRLCQACPWQADSMFGGMSLILFGDFGQLPPVGGSPLYSVSVQKGVEASQGRQLYATFNVVVQLTQIMRQSGNDELQKKFRDALLRLRLGQPTLGDSRDLYMARSYAVHEQLGEVEKHFTDAVRLFSHLKDVFDFNKNCLKNANKPVAIIRADHNCDEAKAASEETAGGLYRLIFLCEGARVMLTSNLWTEKGLVNGSMGHVKAILYEPGTGPPALPETVVVQMDRYNGPTWGGERCVPVCSLERCWSSNKSRTSCKRRQFPLQLAWAVTIHKSQGLTLDRAVIDIGKKEFAPGITYVALSRVRNLNHCLIQSFDFQRISKLAKSKSFQQRLKEDGRLADLAYQTKAVFEIPLSRQLPCGGVNEKTRDFFLNPPSEVCVSGDNGEDDDQNEIEMLNEVQNDCNPLLGIEGIDHDKRPCRKKDDDDQKGHNRSDAERQPSSPLPLLRGVGRTIQPISGDGNCYFRCIAKAVCGDQNQHSMFRWHIVDLMNDFGYLFDAFTAEDITYEQHVQNMRQVGAWATQAEIHATATLYQINLYVFTWFGTHWTWLVYRPRVPMPVPQRHKIQIDRIEIQHYVDHFSLIVQIDRSGPALAAPIKSPSVDKNLQLKPLSSPTAATATASVAEAIAAGTAIAVLPAKKE